MFKRECKHKKIFMDTFATYPTLIQFMECLECGKQFWGFGGWYHEPNWIHEIKEPFT